MSGEWQPALCSDSREDLWFEAADAVPAKTVCRLCPNSGLNGPCVALWAAQPHDGRGVGVWGGFHAEELETLRRAGGSTVPVRSSTTQARALAALIRSPRSAPDLASELGVPKKHMGHLLSTLKRAGWTEWFPNGLDRAGLWHASPKAMALPGARETRAAS